MGCVCVFGELSAVGTVGWVSVGVGAGSGTGVELLVVMLLVGGTHVMLHVLNVIDARGRTDLSVGILW